MNVICINDDAFYALLEEVIKRMNKEKNVYALQWITSDAAMARLNISSKTTLQKLRDKGEIEYSQPTKKIILYKADSIDAYLERHTRRTF